MSYEELTELDASGWELYHVAEDCAETKNVAANNRSRLIEMIGQWYVEAGKYNVLPIDSRGTLKLAEERPQIASDRTTYIYYPHTQAVPANVAAKVFNRPYVVTVEVEIPTEGTEGVLMAFGGNDGGISFYIKDGKLCYVHNYVAQQYFDVVSDVDVPTGQQYLSFEFEVTGQADIAHGKGTPGTVKLFIGDKQVGQGTLPVTVPIMYGLSSGITVGADPGSPVTPKYKPPFEFTGVIKRVRVDVSGESFEDQAARFKAMMARQ